MIDVGIDLDNCAYPFASRVHALAEKKLGRSLPLPKTWRFWE